MGAATTQAQAATGSGPSYASAEGGVSFNLADSITNTSTPIAVPTATGENYSWTKSFAIAVTVTGTTAMTNRTIKMSTSATTGLYLYWKDVAQASYAQAASGTRPASSGSDNSTPSGYTAMTTSTQQWDNTSHATSSTGPNGDLVVCTMGVDNTYVSGANNAEPLPNIIVSYDEA